MLGKSLNFYRNTIPNHQNKRKSSVFCLLINVKSVFSCAQKFHHYCSGAFIMRMVRVIIGIFDYFQQGKNLTRPVFVMSLNASLLLGWVEKSSKNLSRVVTFSCWGLLELTFGRLLCWQFKPLPTSSIPENTEMATLWGMKINRITESILEKYVQSKKKDAIC